jgi:LemA protein
MQWLPLILVFATSVAVIAYYNRFVSLTRRCDQAFADIDVALKQRHDLVPNLVETVKGYAGHERGTLQEVIRARSLAVAAGEGSGRMQAEGALGAALGRLMLLAEAYPDLKASGNFATLSAELADIEDKLAASRRFLNNAVGEYNATAEKFPGIFIAALFGFGKRTFFDLGAEARKSLDTAPAARF